MLAILGFLPLTIRNNLNYWLFLIGILKCYGLYATVEVDIEQAVQNKMLRFQAQGNGKGYYGQCIQFSLQNYTNSTFVVIISAGQTITAVESKYQNMLITRTERIELAGGKTFSGSLYAACIEAKDDCPLETTQYILGPKSSGNLLEIAHFVEKKQYHNQLGSMAIWVVSDKFSIDNVISDDGAATQELVTLLTKLTGQKPGAAHAKINPVINTIETDFIFSISEPISGSIAIYDTAGTVVQPIMKERPFIPGTHELHVRMRSNAVLKGQTYYLRLMVTGKAIRENKILIPE